MVRLADKPTLPRMARKLCLCGAFLVAYDPEKPTTLSGKCPKCGRNWDFEVKTAENKPK